MLSDRPEKEWSFGPPHLERTGQFDASPTRQLWSSRNRVLLTGAPRLLPGAYFLPGPLVDGVVDGHNGLHVLGVGLVSFAPHGLEKHPLRWVYPVPGRVRAALFLAVCRPGAVGRIADWHRAGDRRGLPVHGEHRRRLCLGRRCCGEEIAREKSLWSEGGSLTDL